MATVKELKQMSISDIIKTLKNEEAYTVNLLELSNVLNVSIKSYHFESDDKSNGENIVCAFVTNSKGQSAIFYSDDLYSNQDNIGRMLIVWAFAKYIITGNNSFYITRKTIFSEREKMLAYEMLIPESKVYKAIALLLVPTTYALANIFEVSQEFVRDRLDIMKMSIRIAGYNF